MKRMHRHKLHVALATIAGAMLVANSVYAQSSHKASILPPASSAARVRVIDGPTLESAKNGIAIVRWTSNNPGGSDEHFGIVHYGTQPEQLNETAKSHIRLNQNHSYTVFRVRMDSLRPQTTYYYNVDSMQGDGTSDGLKSPIAHFTTP